MENVQQEEDDILVNYAHVKHGGGGGGERQHLAGCRESGQSITMLCFKSEGTPDADKRDKHQLGQ